MFVIQYQAVNGESRMQDVTSRHRTKLLETLARFQHPILAVYEQSTPITKTIRLQLKAWHGELSRYARDFAFS